MRPISPKDIDIRVKGREDVAQINTAGFSLNLPICRVENSLWIVDNEPVSFGCNIAFTQAVGLEMAKRLEKFSDCYILTVEAKPLAMAFEIARIMGHEYLAVARKKALPGMGNVLSTKVKSITTRKVQKIFLDERTCGMLKEKPVVLFDDVVSTGNTVTALCDLASEAGAQVKAISTVWVEGPWPFNRFHQEMQTDRFIYLDVLPIYSTGKRYEALLCERKRALEKWRIP